MSSTVAAVDVVRADDDASKLLGGKIHFVRALRATEEPERPRAMLPDDRL
jgi:hypothetical protein